MIIMQNDIYSKKDVLIESDTMMLYTYDNSKKRIVFTAREVEMVNGKATPINHWIDFEVVGEVTDVKQRLESFGSIVSSVYASVVFYDARHFDPDGKIWNRFVTFVSENQDLFFVKNGNLRKHVSKEAINELLKLRK